MKRIAVSFLLVCIVLAAGAQTKVTKATVVGTWTVESVELPGMVFYDLLKDSISFGEMIKQTAGAADLASITTLMKQKMADFAKQRFVYNADGTAEISSALAQSLKANYRVDEEKSTIITTDNDKNELVVPVTMKGEKMRMAVKQPEAEVFIVLRKNK